MKLDLRWARTYTTPETLNRLGAINWRDFQIVIATGIWLAVALYLSDALAWLLPFRATLGLIWLLFMPGYCLSTALYAREGDLDLIGRIATSIGFSVALVPLIALGLDRLPWGIHLWPIMIAEYAVTLVSMAVAVMRRTQAPAVELRAGEGAFQPGRWLRDLAWADRRRYLFFAAGLALTLFAAGWAMLPGPANQARTEFYLLGRDGQAEAFPNQAQAGQTLTTTMGIINREQSEFSYSVELWLQPDSYSDKAQLLKTVGPFALKPGEYIQQTLDWQMPQNGDNQAVDFELKKTGNSTIYRQLRLWLDVR